MVLHSGQMGNAASNATGVKEEMKRVVSGFEDIVEKLRLAIPTNITVKMWDLEMLAPGFASRK